MKSQSTFCLIRLQIFFTEVRRKNQVNMLGHNAVRVQLIILVIPMMEAFLHDLCNRIFTKPQRPAIVGVQSIFKSTEPIAVKF